MGCDGGTIPRRVEMVKVAKKVPKLDEENVARIRWQTCALTEQPLREPIVTDELGNVMNREAVLEGLVNKSLGKRFKHIKSVKDLISLKLTQNPAYDEFKKTTDSEAASVPPAQFSCPVTGHEMNGKYKFSVIRQCGHVLSDKALQEVQGNHCLVCNNPYSATEDLIPLHPAPHVVDSLKLRAKTRREAAKAAKKANPNPNPSSPSTAASSSDMSPSSATSASKKRKSDVLTTAPTPTPTPTSGDSATSTASREFVASAVQRAMQSHAQLSTKSDTYKKLFAVDSSSKKVKHAEAAADSDVDAFLVRGSMRAFV